jgi:hypothetical protein
MGRPLKIAKAQAVVTITATNGTTEVVTTNANFTNLGIIAGMPFIPASNVGNLLAGTTYWILQVLNAGNNSTFTVSATELSANPTYTPVNLATAGPVTVSASVGVVDAYFNNPFGGEGYPATNANTYGVVGGNTAIFGSQVLVGVCMGIAGAGTITCADDSPNLDGVGTDFANSFVDGTIVYDVDGAILGTIDDIANANATFATFAANAAANIDGGSYTYGTPEAGFIVRQKGKMKYLVTGTTSGLTQACYTANVANTALLPNTFTITATYANAATSYVQSLSDYRSEVFPATVAAASLVAGTVYTIEFVGTTDFTAVGAFANMTGITFVATGAGSGTGTAVLSNIDPDVIASFNSAVAANTANGLLNPVVTITNS